MHQLLLYMKIVSFNLTSNMCHLSVNLPNSVCVRDGRLSIPKYFMN